MNKIINGVASEYDLPMKYENKTTTVFIDTQDMEERYGEHLYQEYLEKANKELKEKVNQLEKEVERLKEREKLVTEHYDVMVRHAGNLEGKIIQLETNNNTAIDFIDQVLQYHLNPFDYKQVDEDINTLIGILRSDSNE